MRNQTGKRPRPVRAPRATQRSRRFPAGRHWITVAVTSNASVVVSSWKCGQPATVLACCKVPQINGARWRSDMRRAATIVGVDVSGRTLAVARELAR